MANPPEPPRCRVQADQHNREVSPADKPQTHDCPTDACASASPPEKSADSQGDLRQVIGSLLYGGREIRLHLEDRTSRIARAYYDEALDAIAVNIPVKLAHSTKKITLQGYNSAYHFATTGLLASGDSVAFFLPKVLKQQRKREKKRVAAPSTWHLRFIDDKGVLVERLLNNISADGIGMCACAEDEGLFARCVVTPTEIFDGDVKICSLVVELCNVIYGRGAKDGVIFGLRVRALNAESWKAWEVAANAILHPSTSTANKEPGDVWTVFTKSGYLNLSEKNPEYFSSMKDDHHRLNLVFEKNPELGQHTVWSGNAGAQASISCCMLYAHTAVMHQLANATESGNNRIVMRDLLISGFDRIKHNPTVDWVVGMLNQKVRFHQFAFLDFTQPYVAQEKACMLPFHPVEVACSGATAADVGLRVVAAETADFVSIAKRVTELHGHIYAEAFDLTYDRLGAHMAQARWRRVGISRQRRVVLAVDQSDQISAAAVMDLSPKGSNAFSMLDSLTVIPMVAKSTAIDPKALAALFAEAKRWFGQAGKDKFIWHDLNEHLAQYPDATVYDLGPGILWIISRAIISDLQEYWYTRMMQPRNK